MSTFPVHIQSSWRKKLTHEFQKDYFSQLNTFLIEERKQFEVYPKRDHIFEAFNQTSFEKVKVVIIGQDPYHGAKQAHGLSFSVQEGIKKPPSLNNILLELKEDIGGDLPESGNLIKWSKQGVLMLNATLTVRAHHAGSHQKKGWETFTDAVIKVINNELENVVFILWGKYAQKKGGIINRDKHYIIQSAHPSPFAAHRGFFGSKPFSKTNDFLISKGIKPINWSLVDS